MKETTTTAQSTGVLTSVKSPKPLFGALLLGAAIAVAPTAWGAQGSAQTGGANNAGGAKQQGQGEHGGSKQAGGQKGEYTGGQSRGKGGKALEDIFKDIAGSAESDDGDDSDAPDWAGKPGGKSGMGGGKPGSAGSKKGDLFGDLWVILRDPNGVPILSDAGFVQPLDAEGNLIPLDEEGHPVDETLTMEVELGRLNVGRAPSKVLDRRAEEVITLLNEATALTTDAAGRLVLTVDGETKTIDSPLENLALYVALMTTGTIPGVTDLPGDAFDHLIDGEYTTADMITAASLLAAATDKTGAFTTDEVAYINTFIDINNKTTQGVTYSDVDFSAFTYDRSDTYSEVTTTVLVQGDDGSWTPTLVNVYETVFGSVDYSTGDVGTLTDFAQAADDARTVVNFIHEYEVPLTSLETSAVTQ